MPSFLASLLTFSTEILTGRQKPSVWWLFSARTLCLLWNVGSNRAMPHKVRLLEDKYTVSVSFSLTHTRLTFPRTLSNVLLWRPDVSPVPGSHSNTLHTNKLQPERDERDIQMSFHLSHADSPLRNMLWNSFPPILAHLKGITHRKKTMSYSATASLNVHTSSFINCVGDCIERIAFDGNVWRVGEDVWTINVDKRNDKVSGFKI